MGKETSLFRHVFAIGSSTIISMALGLITTPIITRLIDPNEYGQLSIFNMYSTIAVMVLCLGLDQALIRYYYYSDAIEYKRGLFKLCLLVPLSISVVSGGFFLLFVKFYHFEFSFEICVLLVIVTIVTIWNRMAQLLLRVEYKSKKYALCNILQKITYIICIFLWIFWVKNYYFLGLCFSTLISLVIPAVFATFTTRQNWSFKNTAFPENKKEIINFGIPFIVSMGLTTVFQAMDKISLNHYCSYSEVGIYSSAMTIVSIFAIIQTTINTLWGPLQTEHYVKNPEDTSFIQKGNQYITVIMFFMGLSLILCKDIFALLLGEKYRMAAVILPFLIFYPIMYTISETTCSGIGVSKKSYLNIWVSLGACAVNFIGNNILVPIYDGIGAAISTGISYIVFFWLRTYFSNKYYYINYELKKFSIITCVALVYAWYNTFFEFNIITIIGYIVGIVTLLVLYKQGVKELIVISKRQLMEFFGA